MGQIKARRGAKNMYLEMVITWENSSLSLRYGYNDPTGCEDLGTGKRDREREDSERYWEGRRLKIRRELGRPKGKVEQNEKRGSKGRLFG